MRAAHAGLLKSCRKLMKNGADPDAVAARAETVPAGKRYLTQPVLHHAISRGNVLLVMAVLEAGGDYAVLDTKNRGPLEKMVMRMQGFGGARGDFKLGMTEAEKKVFQRFKKKQLGILVKLLCECKSRGEAHKGKRLDLDAIVRFDGMMFRTAVQRA